MLGRATAPRNAAVGVDTRLDKDDEGAERRPAITDVGGMAVDYLSGRGGRLRKVDLWVFSKLSGARTGANGWTGGNGLSAR